jgi:carbon-monoxide dehydrogenase iron sulfur subunit
MDKTLVIIPKNCTGCRTCKVACAAIKGSTGVLGRSRIQIVETGKDQYVQLNCLQCVNAACQAVCPTGALRRNEETRAIEHVEARCISCGLCEAACPFGHIYFDTQTGMPLKCDLCRGEPACARFCPHQALQLR